MSSALPMDFMSGRGEEEEGGEEEGGGLHVKSGDFSFFLRIVE